MINLLILNYEYPPLGGGAGNATQYLLSEFSKIPDMTITVVTSSTGVYRYEQPSDNITIHFLDIGKQGSLHYQSNKDLLRYAWKAWRFCRKYIQSNPVDMVHAFFGVPSGLIALALGLPFIVSLRGSDVPFYNSRFYWLDKLFLKRLYGLIWRKADSVIANSVGLKALAQNSYPEQNIAVIPNGVDTNEFFPLFDKASGGKLKLISTGRLIERKGYVYLLEALKGLDGVELTLVGDGDQGDDLQELVNEYGLKVYFLGRVEHADLPKLLQQADVFILPSLNEGMPNAALEAMACGLPVILTDTGGTKELIDNNGIIIPKKNPDAIQEAIVVYFHDPELLKAHGHRSHEIAKSMSWHEVAEAYHSLYNKVIRDNRGE